MGGLKALSAVALGVPLLLGSSVAPAVASPANGDPETQWREAAASSNLSWSRKDPRGDEQATAAMRQRFPKKARAVDVSRQRYALGAGGLTVITHLRRVIKGKAPYQQYVIQTIVGQTDGVRTTVKLTGRFRGRTTVTTSNGRACSGTVFNASRKTNLAVAFIPRSCLPDRLTKINTVSFNERGRTDISVDRMSSNVPR